MEGRATRNRELRTYQKKRRNNTGEFKENLIDFFFHILGTAIISVILIYLLSLMSK
ncbi:hypothetical protein [Falsibacillus pallidus]|uniref:Uncharacterized protein n=1 Tax=Falsibacillus pallidus TaxID=493781 RepID=A0A370GC16_9BACI|nr:hypothetical protein [Falsibacillus pallidus]RDI39994.1 hypothetical protein DFR59_11316 [Falsibacillus pallidus]